MTTYLTSATYTAARFLTRLLAEIQWPAPPVGSDAVDSWFGDPDKAPRDVAAGWERAVVMSLAATPDQEWGPIGQLARDETFRIPLYVETAIPGRDAGEAWDRLEELTSAIEAAIRQVNAARRSTTAAPEFADHSYWLVAVVSVTPQATPGKDGYVGQAAIVVQFDARIGKPPLGP